MRLAFVMALAMACTACNGILDEDSGATQSKSDGGSTRYILLDKEVDALSGALAAANVDPAWVAKALAEAQKKAAIYDDGTHDARAVRVYTYAQTLGSLIIQGLVEPESLLNAIKAMIHTGNQSDSDFGAFFLPDVLGRDFPLTFDLIGRLGAFVVLEPGAGGNPNATAVLLTTNTANAKEPAALALVMTLSTARSKLIFVLASAFKAVGLTTEVAEKFLAMLAADAPIKKLLSESPQFASLFAAGIYLAYGGTDDDDPTGAFFAMLSFVEKLGGDTSELLSHIRVTLARDLYLSGFNITDLSHLYFALDSRITRKVDIDPAYSCGPDYTFQQGTCIRLLTLPPGFDPANPAIPDSVTFAFGPARAGGAADAVIPTQVVNNCDYDVYGRCWETVGAESKWITKLIPKFSAGTAPVSCGSSSGFLSPGIGITQDGKGIFPAPGTFEGSTLTQCGARDVETVKPQAIAVTVCNHCLMDIQDYELNDANRTVLKTIKAPNPAVDAERDGGVCATYNKTDGLIRPLYGLSTRFDPAKREFHVCEMMRLRQVCNYLAKPVQGVCVNLATGLDEPHELLSNTCMDCVARIGLLAPDRDVGAYYSYSPIAQDPKETLNHGSQAATTTCDDLRYPDKRACATAETGQAEFVDFMPMTASAVDCCFAKPESKGITYPRVCNACPQAAQISGCLPERDDQADPFTKTEVLPGQCAPCGTRTGVLSVEQVVDLKVRARSSWNDQAHLKLCH